jgi:hypothetical protein
LLAAALARASRAHLYVPAQSAPPPALEKMTEVNAWAAVPLMTPGINIGNTLYQFCGLNEDADWGKMLPTWGTPDDVKQLEQLFDAMKGFCTRNDIPAFIGELGVTTTKESASRVRWMSAVMNASVSRRMVPVLWDTGSELSRHEPYAASPDLLQTLKNVAPAPKPTVSIPAAAPVVPPAGAP